MKYYVYKLVDPRDGKPFYVGKGCGNRCKEHIREAKNGEPGLKCAKIRDILAAKLDVVIEKVRWFAIEEEAYAYESQLIAEIGLENLTNCSLPACLPEAAREKIAVCAAMIHRLGKCRNAPVLLPKYEELGKDEILDTIAKWCDEVATSVGEKQAVEEFAKHNILFRLPGEAKAA